MKRLLLALSTLLVLGCDTGPQMRWVYPVPDQCLRAQLFKECLAAVPKGPERIANSNDWEEVVAACADAAYQQSLRQPSVIKPECSMATTQEVEKP